MLPVVVSPQIRLNFALTSMVFVFLRYLSDYENLAPEVSQNSPGRQRIERLRTWTFLIWLL